MKNSIEFTRVNSDINGNSRYVCHFLNFIKDADKQDLKAQRHPHTRDLEEMYKLACKRANKIGGRKFHNKQYGGGIVFQTTSPEQLEKLIHELMETV